MKLRWFQTYDENGVDSSCDLQYWDKEIERWQDVEYKRISEKQGGDDKISCSGSQQAYDSFTDFLLEMED